MAAVYNITFVHSQCCKRYNCLKVRAVLCAQCKGALSKEGNVIHAKSLPNDYMKLMLLSYWQLFFRSILSKKSLTEGKSFVLRLQMIPPADVVMKWTPQYRENPVFFFWFISAQSNTYFVKVWTQNFPFARSWCDFAWQWNYLLQAATIVRHSFRI